MTLTGKGMTKKYILYLIHLTQKMMLMMTMSIYTNQKTLMILTLHFLQPTLDPNNRKLGCTSTM